MHKILGPTKGDAHHCKTLKNKIMNKYIDKIQEKKLSSSIKLLKAS